MQISNPLVVDYIKEYNGTPIRCYVLELGSWNMDANATKTITKPATIQTHQVVSIDVIVRGDTNAFDMPLIFPYTDGNTRGYFYITGGNIVVGRVDGSEFDSSEYNDPNINRGYMTIWYFD